MTSKQVTILKASVPSKDDDGAQRDRFVTAMLDMSPTELKHQSPMRLTVSVLVHILLISAAIILPIYFANKSLNLKGITATYLVAPLPPAPPPPPAITRATVQSPSRAFKATPLIAPRVIPKTVAMVAEAPPPLNPAGGVVGGVPGGTAGGVLGGTLGGAAELPPPPPAPARVAVVRVGGDVKPPRLLSEVKPIYPILAREAKVQGQVIIFAVIDPQGNVVSAHAVSGPLMLVPAALEAVEQWKYAPTYLDGQPVSLAMNVTVDFNMGGGEGF